MGLGLHLGLSTPKFKHQTPFACWSTYVWSCPSKYYLTSIEFGWLFLWLKLKVAHIREYHCSTYTPSMQKTKLMRRIPCVYFRSLFPANMVAIQYSYSNPRLRRSEQLPQDFQTNGVDHHCGRNEMRNLAWDCADICASLCHSASADEYLKIFK